MKILKLIIPLCFVMTMHSACAQDKSSYTHKRPSANGTGKIYMGREIAQVMSFEGVEWLERNSRTEEENTSLALASLPLKPNSVVADIGAGSGFYTFRVAEKIPKGSVYAVEIQDDAIAYLKKKAAADGLSNVTVIKGTEKAPNLPDNSIDLAFMVDVYHELQHPQAYLAALRKALKPKGQILLLEYKEEDPTVAIKPEHKMSVRQAKKELAANGFKLVKNGAFLPLQHFLLFEKVGN
ncbi:class I SAM-dependent methyltransferase [Pedobacter sandarakinus]|uniref:class I SAM-dependent methyltransferase n=1 Tax=Pedobacter sandarakinus TaxID=353156 RepID=UPI0022486BC2|nr:class I SAM-dependent methyltransferase [Pedobacter sandarakinus]MCX2574562.1 class I SAM-dependent methyltransferase [Pedobacter sandarakinus]